MTEAEFEAKKAGLRSKIQAARQQQAESAALERLLEDKLIEVMGAAQQEPWFGEAND